MAIFKHEAVIVTGLDDDAPAIIAFRETMPEEYRCLLVGPVAAGGIYNSFVLMPDGSKEDWPLSVEMDEIRATFIALLQSLNVYWAHVILCNEAMTHTAMYEKPPYIVASNDRKYDEYDQVEYEIWDSDTNNLYDEYRTEDEAYAAVAERMQMHGRGTVQSWGLLHVWQGKKPMLVASGDALIDRALQRQEWVARWQEALSQAIGGDNDGERGRIKQQ